MHLQLSASETRLDGTWLFEKGEVRGDDVEARIDRLIDGHLQKIAISPESGAWEVLYRDPADGRYWELTYPQGEMHGGGPKRLQVIQKQEAQVKYRISLT